MVSVGSDCVMVKMCFHISFFVTIGKGVVSLSHMRSITYQMSIPVRLKINKIDRVST